MKTKLAPMILSLLLALSAIAAEPIKIGVSGPFTGGSASMGVAMRGGILLAVAEINAQGGVLGRRLQTVERDDQGRNEVGVNVAQELIDKEQVIATVGFVNSGVALASQRFYQEAEIPVIVAGSTGTIITRQFPPPDFPHNFIFRNCLYDQIQAEAMADEVVDRRKFRKIAILADSSNYGQLGKADLEAALARRGVTAVTVEKFNIGDVDMTAQLLRAKQAAADVLLTYGLGNEVAQIIAGRVKLGWLVPLVGTNPLSMQSFIDNAGVSGNGVRLPQTFIQEGNNERRKAFIDAYLRTYGGSRISHPTSAAHGYDAVYLLAAAIRQAGSTDGDKIRAALESLQQPVAGVVATYRRPFSPGNHEAMDAAMIVIGEVNNGNVVFAYDEDRQRSKNSATQPRF